MPSPVKLTTDETRSLVEQIGRQLPPLLAAGDLKGQRVELCESFEVWMLPRDPLLDGAAPIREVAIPTRQLHHQIHLDGEPRLFARSIDGTVVALTASPLAEAIDRAISWTDDADPESAGSVRLLTVPSYYTDTFWFTEEDRFVIVQAPADMPELERLVKMDDAAFRSAFRRVKKTAGIRRFGS